MTAPMLPIEVAQAQLASAWQEYLQTGMFIERRYSGYWIEQRSVKTSKPISEPSVRKAIRQSASRLRRPIIVAKTWDYRPKQSYVGAWATFKRRKGMELLAAPLILLADANGSPVKQHFSKSLWDFRFTGDEGVSEFNIWAERVRTDPEWRKAMKLDA